MIGKLHLERQHLETTLQHALTIIASDKSKKKKTTTKGMSKLFASASTFASFTSTNASSSPSKEANEKKKIVMQIRNVIDSMGTNGKEWNRQMDALNERLKSFEHKMNGIKLNKNEIEMELKLKNLENIIVDKEEQLRGMDEQLNSQRILLRQLREQSDAMAKSMNDGKHFQLSNSPTMARQIANKLRMDKQLGDLKSELVVKKEQLSVISTQLSEQCERQNVLVSSFGSNQGKQLKDRISEIQKLYKLREKNLKQRIDSYKKELQKRDKELDNINSLLSGAKKNKKKLSATKMKKELVRELRELQIERSKSLNRRDLKNQIKERDEQIQFLVNHFGQSEDDLRSSYASSTNSQMRSHALSQIDANLTDALAPFQDSLTPRKQNKLSSSAYHFVPATTTSSSENVNRRNKSDTMLQSIFGDENPLQSKYQKKRKKQKKRRIQHESDDDNDEESENETKYESLHRKYG